MYLLLNLSVEEADRNQIGTDGEAPSLPKSDPMEPLGSNLFFVKERRQLLQPSSSVSAGHFLECSFNASCTIMGVASNGNRSLRSRLASLSPPFLNRYLYLLRDLYRFKASTARGLEVAGIWISIHNSEHFRNRFRSEELPVFLAALRQVDVYIDLGANVGFFSLTAATLCKPVISIEPNYRNYKLFLDALSRSPVDIQNRITVLPVAVSCTSAPIWLYGGGQSSSIHRDWLGRDDKFRYMAASITMQSLLSMTPLGSRALVKIDVEGAEVDLLKAFDTWGIGNRLKPVILFEHGRPNSPPRQKPTENPALIPLLLHGYRIAPLKEEVKIIDPQSENPKLANFYERDGSEFNFIAIPDDFPDIQIPLFSGGTLDFSRFIKA